MAGKRPCSVKGCSRILSALVPERITECSHHQYLRLESGRFINDLARENEFSLEDKDFLLSHAFYADDTLYCYASDLRRYLGISVTTFRDRILKGRIKDEREKSGKYHRYLLLAEEAARVMNLVRRWIPITKATHYAGVCNETLRIYTREGYLGSSCEYLNGTLAIKRECLPVIMKLCADIRTKRRKRANRPGRHLIEGEIDVATIASLLKVSTSTVHALVRTGKLKGGKRKGWYAVKEKDFQAFCQQVDKHSLRM